MSWFKGQEPTQEELAMKTKQANCKHEGRFTVYGSNRIMTGTCLDCGKEIDLDEILRVYFRKLDSILDAHGVK